MKRYVAFFLVVLFLFTGCHKGSPTISELVERYGEKISTATVWLYGEDQGFCNSIYRFNEKYYSKYQIVIKTFSEEDINHEQFQKKLSGALLSGDGPDLILTQDPDLVDEYKLTQAGALRSWDEIIKEWNPNDYYYQVVDGARAEDGKLYLLPLEFDFEVIATTKDTVEKYGLTEAHFSDFITAQQTFLSFWEQNLMSSQIGCTYGRHNYIFCGNNIMDYTTEETALLSDENTLWIEQEKKLRQYEDQKTITYESDMEQRLHSISVLTDEAYLFSFFESILIRDLLTVSDYQEFGYELYDQLYLYPMKDMQGKTVVTTTVVAMIPAFGEGDEAIQAWINAYMFDTTLPSECLEEAYHIVKSKNEWSVSSGYDTVLDRLMSEPVKTYFTDLNWYILDNNISRAIDGKSDWEEFERSINIYLSE